jgi:hypothetical protein
VKESDGVLKRTEASHVTTPQAFAGTKSVPEQIKCWTKAVILGKNIPLQIQVNLGTREVIKFYNNGKMPRGLTYYGIKNEISEEYEKRMVDCKKGLGQQNVEQIPILDDDNDPLKLRRVYGLGHDIWSNLNGQSFTTCTLSKVNVSTNPWTLQRVRFLRHHSLDHTSANNLEVINGILFIYSVHDSFLILFAYFFFDAIVGKPSWHLPIVVKLDHFSSTQVTLNLERNIFAENYRFRPTFYMFWNALRTCKRLL